ncbi:MAG: TonB-dependent receptor [Pseudomonadota bacterium]
MGGAVAVCAALVSFAVSAQSDAKHSINLPAQALDASLVQLADQTGVNIIAPNEVVDGQSAPAVSGTLSPEDAVRRLIEGTGLRYEITPSGDFVLSQGGFNQASDRDGAEALMLDQIVVQGELQARSLQDTQTSVAVIDGAELERRSDADIADIAERTSGVTTSFGGLGFVIRGIEESGFGTGTNGGTISVNIDGARVETANRLSSSTFSTWDLEQVEILRGPQSTQSGRNALAGVIEVRSKDPIYDTEVKGRLQAGNGGLFQGAAAFNLPVIKDKLALRVSADVNHSTGFIDNPFLGIDDQDEERSITIRGALRLDPTEDFSAILKFTHFDETAGLGDVLLGSFPDDRTYPVDIKETQETELNSVNLRLGYDISDAFRIESETNYFTYRVDQFLDLDDTAFITPPTIAGSDGDNVEQEVKILYEDDRLRAVVGGFYTSVTLEDEIIIETPASLLNALLPPTVILSGVTTRDADTTNFAFFGEAEYNVLADLRVIAGGRYDRETVDTRSTTSSTSSDPAFAPFLPPDNEIELSSTFDAFLPKLGLVYDFSDDVSIGATVQRGYRAGGVSLNRFRGEVNEFGPEFTWNYEVSLRSEWFDDQLVVNANAFYTDWTDQQVTVALSDEALDFEIINAGNSRVFGGELEVQSRPIPGLELFGSLGYADTEFTDFVSDQVDFGGNEFPFASKFTLAFGGEYVFENGIFMAADANWQDSAFTDLANTSAEAIDSRFLVNARVGYETENWGLFAYATNLFDDDYLTRVFAGGVRGTAGNPRQFGLIGEIRF